MHEYVMLVLWDTFATDILSTVRHSWGKVYKVMNIKDAIWSVGINVCIKLDNDWTQK